MNCEAQTSNTVTFHKEADNTIVTVENQSATAVISLFGGHVLSFSPRQDNRDRLWLSPLTKIDGTESIRGGVPICWPWFSDQFPADSSAQKLPTHGYARTNHWTLTSIETPSADKTIVTLQLELVDKPGFPYRAKLNYCIRVSHELLLDLQIVNLDDSDFEFTGALHSYFSVNNVEDVEVLGLQGTYKDKNQDMATFDTPTRYKITSETDRIHLTTKPAVTVIEQQQKTFIHMTGHDSIVVWNPGAEGAKEIKNIADKDYKKFLCIEVAVTSNTKLAAHQKYQLTQKIV